MVWFIVDGKQYSVTVNDFFHILRKGISGEIQVLNYPLNPERR